MTLLNPFAALVLLALSDWTGRSIAPVVDLQPWADAIASVCMSARECTDLASIAYEESRFWGWAVDQSCNDPRWRQSHQMQRACDGGLAVGPWQIHDDRLLGASAERQASVALETLRRYPSAWSTWPKARARAAAWRAAHP